MECRILNTGHGIFRSSASTSLARLQPLSPFVTPQPLTAAGCQVQPCAPSQAKLWHRQELLKVSDLAEGFLEGIEIEMYWDILRCIEAELQQSLDAAAVYLPSESGEGSQPGSLMGRAHAETGQWWSFLKAQPISKPAAAATVERIRRWWEVKSKLLH